MFGRALMHLASYTLSTTALAEHKKKSTTSGLLNILIPLKKRKMIFYAQTRA